jgi:hypothetical protein
MTRPRADVTDDLLRHIADLGPKDGRWLTDYHRLHRDAPEVQSDRPAEDKRG